MVSTAAHAALVFSWDFTNNHQTFAPEDIVPIFAVLANEITSTENITIDSLSRAEVNFSGNIDNTTNYILNFAPGGVSFFDQFSGIDLSPGESFLFQFGELLPVGGSALAGQYFLGETLLGLNNQAGMELIVASEQEFAFAVSDVPIPGAFLLFLTGLIPLSNAGRSFLRSRLSRS